MKELWESLFSGGRFMPHGHCYLWTPGIVWLHVISDALITLAYYSIPITLAWFVRRRRDIDFRWMFVCFAVFILACGTTHLMEIWNVWHGNYWLSGAIKALTAAASVPTAILLTRLMPQALALPSPSSLAQANATLETEVQMRRGAQEELHDANLELEKRVAERTAELHAANETLQRQIGESERRGAELQLILDGVPAMVFYKDRASRFLRVNRELARLVGAPPEAFIGKTDTEMGAPECGGYREDDLRVMASGVPIHHREEQIHTADGVHWLLTNKVPHRDETGRIAGIIGFSVDVTERKLAEEALRESQAMLRAIIDNSTAVVYVKDLEGRYLLVNSRFEQIFHLTSKVILGRTDYDLFPKEQADAFRAADQRVVAAGTVQEIEESASHDDGLHTYISIKCPLFDAYGKTYAMCGISTDITERKRTEDAVRDSEARKTVIMDSALDCIITADHDGRILEFNPAAQRTFGYSQAEVFGKELAQTIIPPGAREPHRRGIAHYLATGEGPVLGKRIEVTAMRADGSEFPVELAINAIRVNGRAMFTAYLRDITERQRAEAALRQSEARFVKAFQSNPAAMSISTIKDGRFIEINDRYCQLFDYAREELIGRTSVELALWADPAERALMVERMESRVPVREHKTRFRRKNGELIDALISMELIEFPGENEPVLISMIADLTAREQAEARLRGSEERLRLIMSLAPHGIFAKDGAGRYIFVNHALAEVCGVSVEEVLGKTDFDLVADQAQAEAYRADDLAVIESGIPKLIPEEPITDSSGRTRFLQTTKIPFTVPETGERAVLGVWVDITERKRAEEALRASERKMREVIDGLGPNTFLGLMTPDGTLIEANRPGLVAAGVRSEDVLGKPFDETFWWSHSEPVRERLRDAMARGAAGEASRYDVQVRVAGDALVWIDFSLTPVRDADDRVIYLVPSGNVIEERVRAEAAIRESEEHFRFLNDLSEATRTLADPAQIMAAMARMLGEHLGASRCAYADVDQDGEQFTILHDYTDGCVSTVGDYQLSLFGARAVATLHRGETLIIRSVEAELLPAEGADMFNAIGIQAIITCPLVKDGGLRAMMAVHQTTPRDWKSSEIAIVQDVVERCWATIERRAAEEEIHQLNAELEQRVHERTAQLEAANKELEAFSYSVSHDLRSPLRAIDGFSQAVIDDFGPQLPEAGRGFLQTIRDEAQRMGMLIDDLLTFSRLGRASMRKQKVNSGELVAAALNELRAQNEGRQIEVRVGELPECSADRSLLKQVWINLLSNAFKYTRRRDAAVVEIGSKVQDGETVYFVRDNGSGFDMRYAGKLFGVFQRLHRAEEYEGTGVGLALVQRIVNRHDGRVWADAAVDRGATFYFTLGENPQL